MSLPVDPSWRPDDAILDRYLVGDVSADERARVHEWVAAHPGAAERIETIRALVRQSNDIPGVTPATASEWAERIIALRNSEGLLTPAALDTKGDPASRAQVRKNSAPRGKRGIGDVGRRTLLERSWTRSQIFTGVGICCLAMAMIVWLVPASRTNTRSATRYATALGERAVVRLTDGSRVTLAPGTTLTVARGYGRTDRIVSLVGEAFFDIADHAQTPFIVRTGDVTTRVLGTGFDVTRYREDHVVRIVVETGKVQSMGRRSPRGAVTLTAGMIGYLTDSTQTTKTVGDVSTYTDWTDGRIEFRDRPVSDVLAMMQQWFGVQFVVMDTTLLREPVTGNLNFHTTSAALSYLKTLLAVPMTFDRRGDVMVVVLHPRRMEEVPDSARPRRDMQLFKPKMEVGR